VAASELALLSKCLHAPPEKWHGLADVEIRYRQRYLDMISNPGVRDTLRKRAQRRRRGAAVPRRARLPRGGDADPPAGRGRRHRAPFRTHHNTLDLDLQLRIAPELFLKRLLVGGLERVFEIGRNFRNEGISTQHNPEFTMLEFYQAYATFEDLIPLTEELVAGLADEIVGSRVVPYGEQSIDLNPPWRRIALLDETASAAGCSVAELRDLDRGPTRRRAAPRRDSAGRRERAGSRPCCSSISSSPRSSSRPS
jgi:lysyl-tRNA synthetase class 2